MALSARYNELKAKVQDSGLSQRSNRYNQLKQKIQSNGLSSDVDEAYISAFLKDSEEFMKKSQSDYEGLTYSSATSKENRDTRESTSSDLATRAGRIRTYLNANKSKLQKESYNNLTKYLDEFSTFQNRSYSAFGNARQYYSQWETEEDYNKSVTEAKASDTGMSVEELMEVGENFQMYTQKYNAIQNGLTTGFKPGYIPYAEGSNEYWQEYQKQEKAYNQFITRKYEEYQRKYGSVDAIQAQINALTGKTDDRTWFQKGAYGEIDWKNKSVLENIELLYKGTLATNADVIENLGASILEMGEKGLDALALAAQYAAQGQYYQNGGAYQPIQQQQAAEASFDAGKEWAADFVAKDLYDGQKVAQAVISNPLQHIGIEVDTDSVLGEKSDALVQSAGQLAATAGLNTVGVPWFLTSAATAFGGEAESALNEGASVDEAALSGVITASAEILTERLSGITFGGKPVTDTLISKLTKGISNKFVKKLAEFGLGSVVFGEGTEEVLSEVIGRFGQWLTYQDNKTLQEMFLSEEAADAYIESYIGGFVLGEGNNAVQHISTANTGKKVQDAGITPEQLIQIAKTGEADGDAQQTANEIQQKLSAGEKISSYDVGKLVQAIKAEGIAIELTPGQRAQNDTQSGDNVQDGKSQAGQENTAAPKPGTLEYVQMLNELGKGTNAASQTAASSAQPADGPSSVKSQIQGKQTELNAMQPVADIQTSKSFSQLDIAGKINWVIEKLRPTGYKVDRKGFGTIRFGQKQLKGAFNYFKKGSVEETAFEALPYVLENGIEISEHTNHKGRNYGTVTIAAPIVINGKRGNMAVVVKQTTDNFYKVHRILTPDGAVFELDETKNKAEPTPAGELPETGSLATPISSASNNNIPETTPGVKPGDPTGSAPDFFAQFQAMARGEDAAQPQGNYADDIIAMANGTYQPQNAEVDTTPQTNYDNVNDQGGIADGTGQTSPYADGEGRSSGGISQNQGRPPAKIVNRPRVQETVGENGRGVSTQSVVEGQHNGLSVAPDSFTQADFAVLSDDSPLYQVQDSFGKEYNIESHIIKSSAWIRKSPAYAYRGRVYISDNIDSATLATAVPHESTHVMNQLGYQPYLEFIDKTPDAIDFNSPNAIAVLERIAEHRDADVFEMSDAERRNLYDELNATVYGFYKSGSLSDPSFTFGSLIPGAFYDFDSYIKELDAIHEQYRQQRRSEGGEYGANTVGSAQTEVNANPSVGAADQNFTGRAAYQDLLTDKNSQRDRPGDVRPVEVPKVDSYGRKVSEFVGNAYGAEVVPDKFTAVIEDLVQEGALGYDKETNAEALNNAAKIIKEKGVAATRNAITKNISNGKIGDTDIAAAMLLFNQYVGRKSQSAQDNAAEMFVDLQMMATQSGRNLQLFKMLRKMTPQGQLMAVNKNVDRYIQNINKKRSNKKQVDIQIPKEITDEYLEAAQEAAVTDTPENQQRKLDAEQAIYAYAASNIKATMQEKWDAWRYMAMLGNPKTHIRNVLGNAMFRPFVETKRYLGAALETAFLEQDQRTKAVLGLGENDRALLDWAKQDSRSADTMKRMEYTATTGDAAVSEIGDQRQIFKNKALEKSRTKLNEWMTAEDMFAKRGVYTKALASFLKARGVTAGQLALMNKPDVKIVSVAQNTSGKSYADLKNEVLRKAEDNHWFESPHTNTDTGMPIFVNQRSFTHAFSNLRYDFGADTILAMGHIPELIESSVLTKIDPPKNPRKAETRVFTFFGAISGENGVEPVKLTVKEYSSKNENEMPQNILNFFRKNKPTETYNSLYDVKALEVIGIESVKKESGASASVAGDITRPGAKGTPNSTIKVAELLSLVKGDAVKYIPKNLVDPNILNEARDYAVKEAMKATFNDQTALSNFLANTMRYKGNKVVGKVLNAAAEGVLPFRRTPANIAVRAVEYSPAGLLKTALADSQKLRSGEITAAEYIDRISAGLTGSAAMALGAALASGIIEGIRLVGTEDEEDEKRMGHKSYALEVGNMSIPINWAAPAAMPLFMGANLYDAFNPEDENVSVSVITAFLEATANTLEPMLELSCLSSLNDLLTDVRYAEEGREIYSVAASIATSYFMQGLPTLGGQIEQAFEGEKKSVYAESSDPLIKDFQKVIGQATQRIPGIDLYQTEKVDAWGRTEEEKNVVQSVFDAFINPSNYSQIRETDADQEIKRLNGIVEESISPNTPTKVLNFEDADGIQHKDYRLSAEEYTALAKRQGQIQKRIVDDIITNGDYDLLSDEDKAKAIRYAYDYARDCARGEVIDEHPGITTKWMTGISGDEAAAIIRYVATGTTEKYLDLSVKDAAYVADILKMIEPETGYKNPRTIQKVEAVANADNQLTEEKQRGALGSVLDEDAYEKFQNILALGYGVDDYAASYRIYLDEKEEGGKGTKDRIIREFRQEFGISKSAATKLYECYVPPKD